MTKTLTFGVFILSVVFIGSFVGQTPAQKVRAVRETATTLSPTAVLLTEDFNFSGALSANGWSPHSGIGTNPLSTTAGLTYPGLAGSGVGNAALVGNAGGEDANRALSAEQSGDGSVVFFSFLVNVNEAASAKTGDYFMHLGDRVAPDGFTLFAARVFARVANDNVNFGLSNTSTATYGTTNFAKNTTYLVVVKYTISTAGNDSTQLWVVPSGVPASEAAAGTPEVTNTSTSGQDVIDAIGLRQGSNANQAQAVVDAIRVGNTWGDVLSAGEVRRAPGDFDGNGRTDFSIVREGPGGAAGNFIWWIKLNGPNTTSVTPFGLNSDFILPADYDGDGADDIAIWRGQQGTHGFWVLNSSTGTASFHPFGQAGDDPVVVADYSGDGVDDFAIYRPDPVQGYFWMWLSSGPYSNQYSAVPWGSGDDSALFGDYNGDGFGDFTVTRVEGQRIRIWTLFGSPDLLGQNFVTDVFGGTSDLFVPGDYDGDGATDLAVTRWVGNSLRWIYKPSSGGPVAQINWGIGSGFDFEVHGDYDGDGTTDLAVWRTNGALAGYYIVRLSSGGVRYEPWGTVNDTPTIWEFK